jgi:hypothetical protein
MSAGAPRAKGRKATDGEQRRTERRVSPGQRVGSGRQASAVKALPMNRRQVLAFRMDRLGLLRRQQSLAEAVGELGLPDFPPGAALAALAPRLTEVSPTTLEKAFEARELVRVRAMRGAPLVVRPADVAVFTAGLLPRDERSMRAFIGPATRSVDAAKMTALEAVARVAEESRRALVDRPLDRDDLHARLRERLPRGLLPYCQGCGSHHVHPSLLYPVALSLPLLLFPRKAGPYLVALANTWLASKGSRVPPLPPGRAAKEVLRRFLREYGPATVSDFAGWAGIGGGQPQAIWAVLAEEMIPVAIEGGQLGGVRWMLAEDRTALSGAVEDKEAPTRLISPGDPLLQARDRDTLVPDPAVQKVVWKNLSPSGVVIAGGDTVGTARMQKKKDAIEIEVNAFSAVGAKVRRELEAEAQRLGVARGVAAAALRWR